MANFRFHRILFPAISAAALLCASAPALAQDVGGIDVQGHAPTTLRIAIRGLDAHAVGDAVRVAAGTVCRNAIGNHEVGIGDLMECRDASADKAMRHYRTLVRSRTFAQNDGLIVLSAR